MPPRSLVFVYVVYSKWIIDFCFVLVIIANVTVDHFVVAAVTFQVSLARGGGTSRGHEESSVGSSHVVARADSFAKQS